DLRIGFSFGEFSSRDYYLRLSWNRPTFTLAIAQASAEVTVAEEVPLIQAQSPCQKTSWVPSGDHFAWPDLEQGSPGFPAKPGALFVRLTSSLPSTLTT